MIGVVDVESFVFKETKPVTLQLWKRCLQCYMLAGSLAGGGSYNVKGACTVVGCLLFLLL